MFSTKFSKKLPINPSLEQLRRQSKELVRAYRSGDQNALERILSELTNLSAEVEKTQKAVTLSIAQLIVAREYGFESWPKMKFFIESQALSLEEKMKLFIKDAVNGRLFYAKKLLEQEPRLNTQSDLVVACLIGDLETVQKILEKNPKAASVEVATLKGGFPLMYVAYSQFQKENLETAKNLLKIAELLLSLGADPDICPVEENGVRKTPLYGACGVTNFPEMAELLLKNGANPNDGESLYHAVGFQDGKCLKILLNYGADFSKEGQTLTLHHALDFDNLANVKMLIDAGADIHHKPDELGNPLHHAIIRGRKKEFIELLLQSGANPDEKNSEGKTPLQLAMYFGNVDAVSVLSNSKEAPLSLEEKFISAASFGDLSLAKDILRTNPQLMNILSEKSKRHFAEMAALNNYAAVSLMLEVGFDVNQRGEWGPAIHHAAWHGNVEIVKLLIEKGANLEALNDYGGTTLEAALYATIYFKSNDEKYTEIVELLLDAGAIVNEKSLNYGNENVSEIVKTFMNL